MTKVPETSAADRELWLKMLNEGHVGHRMMRSVFRHIPSAPRCKGCNNPFGGVGGRVFRALGFGPSKKNPHLCAACCEHMPAGGAEVETTVMFADVRGSTRLAEELGPTEYVRLLNRFYKVATDILIRRGATVDKLIGDEVMAFFVPGYAGPEFRRLAVESGVELLAALRDETGRAWLPVGVGIDSGVAFVGVVGGEKYMDFTALGDPVNAASRIQMEAGAGELLVGEETYRAVEDRYPDAPRRTLSVKGKDRPLAVRAVVAAEALAA